MQHVARIAAISIGLILAIGSLAPGQVDRPELAEIRAALRDKAIPIEERVRRALEGAIGLDQAAQKSNLPADRRALWQTAVSLLDEFAAQNPDVESAPLIRFQAGVYRWAEGRSFAEQFELAPSNAKARTSAIESFDDATRRLREIKIKPDEATETFAQNVRFRLAQAIADRSLLDPDSDENRTKAEREALGLLDSSLSAPALRPFASVLRSELYNRLGLFGQAQMEIEQAEKLTPGPPAEALLSAKVTALSGRGLFDDARKAVETAKVSDPLKGLLALRIVLVRRREKPAGTERGEIDDEAFRLAETFKGSNRPEARRALIELARTIDEPGKKAPADWWDLLAEGHLRLGNPVRSGRLEVKGADRADALDQPEKASSLRYKSGAYLFEAGRFLEADRSLTRVLDSPGASRDLKARAGMLRALARGRALATHDPEASRPDYLAALEAQVRDFPLELSTGEARWLLGQIRMTAGRPELALDLWSKIQHGHPRWLEANLLIAERLREAVEIQTINRDSAAISAKMDLARKSLRTALDQAGEGPETVNLTLQLALLELIPDAGRPVLSINACDRVLKSAAQPEQHRLARLYKLVAFAQSGRFSEAEQLARSEARSDDLATLLPVLRLLDRAARETEAEVTRRRYGLISRILSSRIVDHLDLLPTNLHDEARLHHARSLLFAGDLTAAKKAIAEWGGPTETRDDEFLRELADTYQRLDAYVLAVDAERHRSSRLVPGSLPWFESRYGMALAYYRNEQPKDAVQIIDATSILHPDLGGGELRIKFDRLRQRIGKY
jgi:tetratricopeptide (TPR) repeat protein